MYPLLLKAPLKDYLWGGTRLKDEYGFESDKEKVAEAWMLSCHKDGNSVVKNGDYAGLTLQEVFVCFFSVFIFFLIKKTWPPGPCFYT